VGDPLRVLVVEDVEDDYRLLLHQLHRAGYELQPRRVEDVAQLRQALADGEWQIVISDWLLPTVRGMAVLEIVRHHDPELPFVVVSGTADEEVAVEAMRAGAQDVVSKDRLTRIGQVVSRELGERQLRQQTRKAETNLAQSEQRLLALIENALDLIAVLDRDGTVRFMSPASRHVLGYAPEAFTGRVINAWIHPDDLVYLESDAVGMLGGLVDGNTVTVRFRHADGHWIWIEAVGRDLTGVPAVGGVVVNARDVTQRRDAELGMARLVQAVEQTSEAIVVTDASGIIEYVNPAFEQITGYRAREAIGRNPRILKSGQHPRSFYEAMWNTLLSGQTWSGQITNRRRDGDVYQEEATISPVVDHSGAIVHFVAVKRDITETLALESQLQQAQKMEAVGRLAGGIAHDFNNLLTLLVNHAEFLKDSLGDDPRQLADIDGILSAAQRATDLTRQLLTFSRREMTQPELVDVNKVIQNVERLLLHTIGEDIDLICELADDLPPIQADPGKLEQALLNLVINARDAMPRGGMLRIITSRLPCSSQPERQTGLPPGEYLTLTVSDTGHGMSAAVATRVFEPYFTTKPKGKGTGLGLSTVFGIVSQAGGGIAVHSEVGQGAAFVLYFPASNGSAEQPSPPRSEEQSRGGGGEVVLLVEDEESVRRLTSRILEVNGYTVYSAANGQDGLDFSLRHDGRIDLLLTDVVMPGMSGVDFVRAFSKSRPEVPVIYMSGYTADITEAHGLPGGLPTLQKPFTAGQLVRQVQASLGGARKDSGAAT